MTPERYQEALKDAIAFTAEANRLSQLACPIDSDRPIFSTYMSDAKRKSMTWVEGLRYVIQQRSVGLQSVDDR